MEHFREPEKIKSMFAKVAGKYDLANTVLSFGVHHLWRKRLVQISQAQPGSHVLDCATGTGDLAIEFKKIVGKQGLVIGTDFCEEMLRPATAKAREKYLNIQFETADVTNLKYPDNMFDITSISFGIRNVSDPAKALHEMARVTKTNGKVMILEFGQVSTPVFSQIYSFYSEKILPKIGGLVTGQKNAYEYLHFSAAEFPCKEKFITLMRKTDKFSAAKYHSLSGGIAYIYTGIKK